jgi:hypothetical protein
VTAASDCSAAFVAVPTHHLSDLNYGFSYASRKNIQPSAAMPRRSGIYESFPLKEKKRKRDGTGMHQRDIAGAPARRCRQCRGASPMIPMHKLDTGRVTRSGAIRFFAGRYEGPADASPRLGASRHEQLQPKSGRTLQSRRAKSFYCFICSILEYSEKLPGPER